MPTSKLRICGGLVLALGAALPFAAHAEDNCDALDAMYPQPGRAGQPGENAFRPLPVAAPVRSEPGGPGTLSLSIHADHVSDAPAGKPGFVWVGNYKVTDIPVFRIGRGANTTMQVIRPNSGKVHPISDKCLAGSSWGYAGTEWSLVQGDTLDVMFSSRLDFLGANSVQTPTNGAVPCRASNLHTHGLLVIPYHPAKAGLGPYGDYVLDVTQPRDSYINGSSRDTCGVNLGDIQHLRHGLTTLPLHYVTAIPGHPGVNSLKTGEHPSGLFWYHAHPHGYSQPQVAGGMTGALTVGSLADYACPDGDGSPGNCNLSNTTIRTLELKDLEIRSYGGTDALWSTMHSSESGLCDPTGGIRHGECMASESGNPGKWVFTVNGVQYPTMHAQAGRMEIWRVINASVNVTYALTIASEAGAENLPFQVLSVDGVAERDDFGKNHRTSFMLMPASRVEIAIPAPAHGGLYVLRNSTVQTGQSGVGDVWPQVDLARIRWEAPGQEAQQTAQTSPQHVTVVGEATKIPTTVQDQSSLPARCHFKDGDTRVVYFVHRFKKVFSDAKVNPPVNPLKLEQAIFADDDSDDNAMMLPPPSGLHPSVHEIFGLISGVRHADGTMDFWGDNGQVLHSVKDVWQAGITDGDNDFPGFGHNKWATICTVKGNVEPWELQNWTGENHNFHIHQTKFTLNPNGKFQFPNPKAEPNEDATLRTTDAWVRRFLSTSDSDDYHDTVPVPRGQSLCRADPSKPGCHNNPDLECSGKPESRRCHRPGIESLILDFSRNEQVGTFVYHCHILEHEDGGMMAEITVMCPAGDTACAALQARENICRASN